MKMVLHKTYKFITINFHKLLLRASTHGISKIKMYLADMLTQVVLPYHIIWLKTPFPMI